MSINEIMPFWGSFRDLHGALCNGKLTVCMRVVLIIRMYQYSFPAGLHFSCMTVFVSFRLPHC